MNWCYFFLFADRGILKSQQAADAMSQVDRKFFVPIAQNAYNDVAQVIGYGATISAPHMVRSNKFHLIIPLLVTSLDNYLPS